MTRRTPQVGDTITTAEELDEFFSGTVVLDTRGDAYLLGAVTARYASRFPPLTILYLPGQPPRPERVVKAEALREWADSYICQNPALTKREAATVTGNARHDARAAADEIEQGQR